jgi:hypothetical protein
MTVVWIEKGLEFLAYVGAGRLSPRLRKLAKLDADTGSLLANMKNMADGWEGSLDAEDGSLRFYID